MAECENCIHKKVCSHRANIQTDTYAYMGIKYDTEKCEYYTADVVPKSEVASEIFAEVNMQIIPYSTDIYIKGEELIIIPKSDYNAILTELEKKYTEGEDKPASEEKYFSPEDVRKMTNQEVREKYTAIRRSMERW